LDVDPSLHVTIAAATADVAVASVPAADDAAVFEVVFAAARAAFVAARSTPPWPEQAPRPETVEVVLSLQIVVAVACPNATAGSTSAAATNAETSVYRVDMVTPDELPRTREVAMTLND
jgi:hypothetical protein